MYLLMSYFHDRQSIQQPKNPHTLLTLSNPIRLQIWRFRYGTFGVIVTVFPDALTIAPFRKTSSGVALAVPSSVTIEVTTFATV
jgi:hypothetical protein